MIWNFIPNEGHFVKAWVCYQAKAVSAPGTAEASLSGTRDTSGLLRALLCMVVVRGSGPRSGELLLGQESAAARLRRR